MRTAHIALLVALTICSQAEQTAHARELLSFGPSAFQSKDKLASSWQAIADNQRDQIQRYLFRLGLSSTGVVQLIGVYRDDASGALLHFQQLDLFGTRLVWSVLVNPDDMTARVIYHTQHDQISDSFAPFFAESDA
jgi:hypothetical protein